jgi:hypothetical protein
MKLDFEKKILDYGAQIEDQAKQVKILQAQAHDLEIKLTK